MIAKAYCPSIIKRSREHTITMMLDPSQNSNSLYLSVDSLSNNNNNTDEEMPDE